MAGSDADADADANANPDFRPSLSAPASASSDAPAPRRSSRVRTRAARAVHSSPPPAPSPLPVSPDSPAPAARRLEQVAYASAQELQLSAGDPAAGLRVRLHPVAAVLMSVHAHLTRNEVIGYLGGTVHRPHGCPGQTEVVVAEAFAARALGERVLAKTGRSAYMEVEIDPESSVEVMACIHAKGLEVVGWYHSHPDECFTVEPSRVDIENQYNYQKHLFKEKPFVAAIIAPYNEDLPDHSPAVEFFRVHDGEVPLRIPHAVDTLSDVPTQALPGYWGGDEVAERKYPLPALAEECRFLIEEHKQSARRVRLGGVWREGWSCADKLRGALVAVANVSGPCKLVHGMPDLKGAEDAVHEEAGVEGARAEMGHVAQGGEGVETESEAVRLHDCVHRVVDGAETAFAMAAAEEAERRAERKKRVAAQKTKRSRRR